jgi:hypothetical protein
MLVLCECYRLEQFTTTPHSPKLDAGRHLDQLIIVRLLREINSGRYPP